MYSIGDKVITLLSGIEDYYSKHWTSFNSTGGLTKFEVVNTSPSQDIYLLKNSGSNQQIWIEKNNLTKYFKVFVTRPDALSYIYVNTSIGSGSSCECGASKTYGKNVTSLHHSFWCPMRKS